MSQIEGVYKNALELLRKLSTENGFTASLEDVANYKRIWTRDGIIMGLAAMQSGDISLIATLKQTLLTIRKHQDETGRLPSNVSIDAGQVSYGTTVGRIDATIWYVVGVCEYFLYTKDKAFWADFKNSAEKALWYLKCLELNGRGFLYIPQGGDWADEYINHGYVLYDQMLYYFALAGFAKCSGDQKTSHKRDYLKEMIRVNFLPDKKFLDNAHIYHPLMYGKMLESYQPPLPVTYFSNHSVRFHIDMFATSLLLLSGLLEEKQVKTIRNTIIETTKPDGFPILPAFFPVIKPGEENWEQLEGNFLFEFRNKPHEYHNGGLWPLLQGFFLVSDGSNDLKELDALASVLKDGRDQFPEFFHGQTFKPSGTKDLGMSAAGFILAYQAKVKNIKVLSNLA